MMKALQIIVCCFCLFAPFSMAEEESPFYPVIKLFSAMSDSNHDGMRSAVTDNFQLLEHGEIWDINILTGLVKPSGKQRKNFFSVISSDVQGRFAFINYWNKAQIRDADSIVEYVWLESVVVLKEGGDWKLQQMHSTRVDSERLPEGIKFTAQYIRT